MVRFVFSIIQIKTRYYVLHSTLYCCEWLILVINGALNLEVVRTTLEKVTWILGWMDERHLEWMSGNRE